MPAERIFNARIRSWCKVGGVIIFMCVFLCVYVLVCFVCWCVSFLSRDIGDGLNICTCVGLYVYAWSCLFVCWCLVVCLLLSWCLVERRETGGGVFICICVCMFVFVSVLMLACVCWCVGVLVCLVLERVDRWRSDGGLELRLQPDHLQTLVGNHAPQNVSLMKPLDWLSEPGKSKQSSASGARNRQYGRFERREEEHEVGLSGLLGS